MSKINVTNVAKQITEIRTMIHNRERSIRGIKFGFLRDEAYDSFQLEKLELMKQMRKLREQQRAAVVSNERGTFDYGKMLNVRFVDDVLLERTPLKVDQSYDPNVSFMGHEVSGFANLLFGQWTWMDYVTDDPEALKTVLYEGYGDFKCIYAGWSDQDGKAILVHRDCPYNTLEDAGIMTNMTNVTQSVKCRKYIGRCFAPGDMNYAPRTGRVQEGSWIEASLECVIEMDNTADTLVVRYIDIDVLTEEEKATVDGHIGMSDKAHRVLGLSNHPEIGDSWKVTVLAKWLGKGHSHRVGDIGADIVIYGPKKLVGLKNDKFCFMSLGELHAGSPNLEMQSVTNFKLYGLAKELARKCCRYIHDTAHDEKLLRRAILSTVIGKENEEDLYDPAAEDNFVMRKAVMRDISLFAFPGLYRRAVRFMTRRVLQFERFRIPMNLHESTSVAIIKYASMQPVVILDNGDIDMERSLLGENECCIPDLPAGIRVVVYRQPNENTNAHWFLTNIHVPEYMAIKGKSVCFLGRQVQKLLGRLGGGDMDDALIVIYDAVWVKHFEDLAAYPESDKLVPVEVPAYVDMDEFGQLGEFEAIDYSRYDANSADYQISLATTGGTNLGSAVNATMMDAIVSDPIHMASMIADLEQQGYAHRAVWLANEDGMGRQPYTTAFLATNQELLIDASVKDPALMEALRQEANNHNPFRNVDGSFPEGVLTGVQGFISAYHATQQVYPHCMAMRIPKKKRDAKDFVLAMSEQCKVQEAIMNMLRQLDQIFVQNEWKLARKADPEIVDTLFKSVFANYPKGKTYHQFLDRAFQLVHGVPGKLDVNPGLRRKWAAWWRENMTPEQADRKDKFAFVCDQLDNELLKVPNDIGAISIQLYQELYKHEMYAPVKNLESGLYQSFSDSLFWTNKIANAFINLLITTTYIDGNGVERAMAGAWIGVRFFVDKHLSHGEHELHIENGIVYNKTGDAVGETNPKLRPRVYKIVDGLIRARQVHSAFQPKMPVLEMIQPLASKQY